MQFTLIRCIISIIINTDNTSDTLLFRKISIFSILVLVRDGKIKLIYYFTLVLANILTKTSTFCTIDRYKDKSFPINIKDITKEQL